MRKKIWSIIGYIALGGVTSAIVVHLIWFAAVQGLIESDVSAAILVGNTVMGEVTSIERFEDGYLAYILTESFGEVAVKVSVEEQRAFTLNSTVEITCDLRLKEVTNE